MLLKLTSKVCEQNLKRNVLSLPYQDAVSLWKSLSRDTDLSLEFLCVDNFRFITFQLISLWVYHCAKWYTFRGGTTWTELSSWDKVMQHSTLSPDWTVAASHSSEAAMSLRWWTANTPQWCSVGRYTKCNSDLRYSQLTMGLFWCSTPPPSQGTSILVTLHSAWESQI